MPLMAMGTITGTIIITMTTCLDTILVIITQDMDMDMVLCRVRVGCVHGCRVGVPCGSGLCRSGAAVRSDRHTRVLNINRSRPLYLSALGVSRPHSEAKTRSRALALHSTPTPHGPCARSTVYASY